MHNIGELNEYVGVFAAGCLFALIFCCYALGLVGNAIYRFPYGLPKG
jgi:hypothetical protein